MQIQDHVSVASTVRLIADTVSPRLTTARGIQCIRGRLKVTTLGLPPMPVLISPEDRLALEPLLNILPKLSWPISKFSKHRFLRAYKRLADRPSWCPVLISQENVDASVQNNLLAYDQHFMRLKEEVRAGRLHAFDEQHQPVHALTLQNYITLEAQTHYLKRLGIAPASEKLEVQDDIQRKAEIVATDVSERVNTLAATSILNVKGDLPKQVPNPQEPRFVLLPRNPKEPKRKPRDAMGEAIRQAVVRVGNFEPKANWNELVRFAEKKEFGLIEVVNEELKWADPGRNKASLKREDLKSRLFTLKKFHYLDPV